MNKSSASLPVQDLSEEDLSLFFNVKFSEMACPVCGRESFDVLFSDGDRYLDLKSGPGDRRVGYPVLKNSFPALVLTCDNCAHVLLFSYVKVLDLIRRIKSEVGNGRS